MLAIVPILAFIGTWLVLVNRSLKKDWRPAFLRAAILWGVYTILVTELLSFVRGVTPAGLALVWALPTAAAFGWLGRRRSRGLPVQVPTPALPPDGWDRVLLAGVALILAITALIAWLAPPQTWDSLNYHMPRVAHWAQERAVRHYATGISVQNSWAPGAEIAVLQYYVLAGGDRLANFVAWFAMFGSLVGTSWIAGQLGAPRRGQLLAAVITATIPMGIVQASSTMTDYVAAFWVVCAAAESLDFWARGPDPRRVFFISAAAGLALVTKLATAPYLLPFAVIAAAGLYRRVTVRQLVGIAVAAILIVSALNVGHLVRNFSVYGNPLGDPAKVGLHTNQNLSWRGVASNVLRNAALHSGTPYPTFNQWIYDNILKTHIKLGLEINDPGTTSAGSFRRVPGLATHEDLVGNLAHAVLILMVAPLALVRWRPLGRLPVFYMAAVIAGFLTFSLVFKWQIFASRLHMPFFVLFAPLIAVVFSRVFHENTSRLVGLALLVGALPWLVGINSRPLFPLPGRASVRSVLVESRETLLYVNGQNLIGPHQAMLGLIEAENCSTVGVAISGSGAEYPYWVGLGAPRESLQIEWLVGGPSARLEKPDFQPCAVICQKCPEAWETIRGLPKVYDDTVFRLYLAETP